MELLSRPFRKLAVSPLMLAAMPLAFVLMAPLPAYADCGDGIPEQEEQCDDGNKNDGDCCSSTCTLEEFGQPCADDGNQCRDDICNGEGSCIHPIIQFGECDDGNACTLNDFCNSDGFCSSKGTLEDGDTCFDERICGGQGSCSNGFCNGEPADCDGVAGQCETAQCNPDTFRCETTAAEDGSPCGQPSSCFDGGKCESGECIPTPRDCSEFADQCNDAACDPEAGGCFSRPKDAGTPCDDDTFCTINDSCLRGLCFGDENPCSEVTNACRTGFCNGDTDSCDSDPQPNGTECDDGNACTTGDQCVNGTCTGTPVDCSDFDDQCNAGICNGQTGECEKVPVEEPTSCDDGSPCTVGDACSDGVCAGEDKDCSEADGPCAVGVCSRGGDCVPQFLEDGTTCDDGDSCTTEDSCSSGACGGDPVVCSPSNDPCLVNSCNPQSGQCEPGDAEDGTVCNDGNACTQKDDCTNGECAGDPIVCSPSGNACRENRCNVDTGQCQLFDLPDETTCNDGKLCTTGDVCTDGSCNGSPVECPLSGNECQISACNPDSGDCELSNVEDGEICDDANSCTTGDSCSAGTCDGEDVVCPPSQAECQVNVCVPATGECEPESEENGSECDDGLACTDNDDCQRGECSGDPIVCPPPGEDCQTSSCNPDTGQCVTTNGEEGGDCDDGNSCTTGDVCTKGICAGTPVDCSNLSGACVVGSCNSGSGQCEALPRENGTGCNDGNACTSADQCTAGVCGGTPVDCSGLDDTCNDGICNPQSGQCEKDPKDDGTSCSDGAFCTETDTCSRGECAGSGNPCDGNEFCANACNEASDICARDVGTACASDGNVCTDDVCDGEGSCVHEPNTGACDDGLFCTVEDRCVDGECTGDPACPQSGACPNTCNETENACKTCGHPFSNTRCIVNAVFVLQGALGLRVCDLCTCDVDSNGIVNASDALRILRTCASLPSTLTCPEPEQSTTTTIGI